VAYDFYVRAASLITIGQAPSIPTRFASKTSQDVGRQDTKMKIGSMVIRCYELKAGCIPAPICSEHLYGLRDH
jgi:hypothetical protein